MSVVGGEDVGHLGRDDAVRDTGSVVLATTLVTAIVVSEDSLVVCRASVTELVGALRAGYMITSTGLINEDFASGARREGLRDEGFCSLVLKVAIALTNLTHGLTVANVARDRNRCGSGYSGTIIVRGPVCIRTKAVIAELFRASCACRTICQLPYKMVIQLCAECRTTLTNHMGATAISLDSCTAASRADL